ncbi:HAD family hydrolase [Saccharopolyspora phatthalungensis]|uniref:Phosphoglycolate phosphatase n=1 Tax=Saccharopolyspora phatthalungensis TaxID=664693 RepID=A0A840PU37_9PSEU|nr:HAD hydrolase-like protein [Saccharopolyspora phatthalungensis]MBB5153812.1 phosphoglycolate phosphatase [Saccharopolyspora phatthalungensis]
MAEQRRALTVGFDLDMTLIDPRPGMVRAFDALNEEFELSLDGEHFAANLGPPLVDVMRGYGFDEPMVERLVTSFRQLYPTIVVGATQPMPGAAQALDVVRDAGGRTLVITGKYGPNAGLHLKAFGWDVDRLAGDVFAAAKGEVLREEGATIYVGDHLGDIVGAKAAGAVAVGVATGPYGLDELDAAGADVALRDLTEFPAWFAQHA